MSLKRDHGTEIEAIEQLLPWYAAGTLDPESAERVKAALAREPALRLSLSLIREDQDETVAQNESLGAPSADALGRLLERVKAEPRKPNLWRRLATFVDFNVGPATSKWAYACAAAMLVIALQASYIVTRSTSPNGPRYDSASEPSKSQDFAVLLITFAPEARLDQVVALLRARDASIIAGPNGGIFRVRVSKEPLSKEQLATIVAQFSADPIVQVALPAPNR